MTVLPFEDFPQIIVEAGFDLTAATGAYWHIGDEARGKIGTFALPGPFVWADITSYALGMRFTAGTSSRVTVPVVVYEAGSLSIALDNSLRAFDPLNTTGPFYVQDSSTVLPVPGTLSQAITAIVAFTANDAQVQFAGTAFTNAAAGIATDVAFVANNPTVTGTTGGGSAPDGMIFGSTQWGSAAAATTTINLTNAQKGRAYERTSTTTFGATSFARFIPATLPQLITFKGTTSVWADPTSNPAAYTTETGNVIKVLRGLSVIPGHSASYWHEPVNDMSPSDWSAANINFKKDVLDVVNADAARSAHKIWFEPVMNGFPPNTGGTPNSLGPVNMAAFWTPALLAVVEIMDWDCYQSNDDQITRLHDYATTRGLPWAIGELGYSTGNQSTDAQMLGVMQFLMASINGWPVSERPKSVLWFRQGKNELAGTLLAAPYWKNVCTNSTIPATV